MITHAWLWFLGLFADAILWERDNSSSTLIASNTIPGLKRTLPSCQTCIMCGRYVAVMIFGLGYSNLFIKLPVRWWAMFALSSVHFSLGWRDWKAKSVEMSQVGCVKPLPPAWLNSKFFHRSLAHSFTKFRPRSWNVNLLFLASEEQYPVPILVGINLPLYFHVLTDIHFVLSSPFRQVWAWDEHKPKWMHHYHRPYCSYLHLYLYALAELADIYILGATFHLRCQTLWESKY